MWRKQPSSSQAAEHLSRQTTDHPPTRLQYPGQTLVCTNMIESMIGIARTTTRNVKRWRDEGDMRRRSCAAGLLEAEKKFRRVRGHAQMPHLVTALARHAESVTPPCETDPNEDLAA